MRQNPGTGTSGCNRVMVHGFVILLTARFGPQPSGRLAADPARCSLRWSCSSALRAAGDDAGAAETSSPRTRESAVRLGRCAHRVLKPSSTTPASSRSHRHSSGNAWCAGQTSRTCEQAPAPAATPAETCSRGCCATVPRTRRLALELLERTAGRPAIIANRDTYETRRFERSSSVGLRASARAKPGREGFRKVIES